MGIDGICHHVHKSQGIVHVFVFVFSLSFLCLFYAFPLSLIVLSLSLYLYLCLSMTLSLGCSLVRLRPLITRIVCLKGHMSPMLISFLLLCLCILIGLLIKAFRV